MITEIVDSEFTRLGDYGELMADRTGFQRAFCDLLLSEPGLRGRVLDVGCGGGFPRALSPLVATITWLDGVDPSDAMQNHPGLKNRWQGRIEDSDVPEGVYDLALAYNVVEHVEDPARFLAKVSSVLKPGGVFWFLTPHSLHPFCAIVRFTQAVGRRGRVIASSEAREGRRIVNDYPAFYRMNCRRDVLRHARGLGFKSAEFHWMPCMQWDRYFPPAFRWMAHLYDWLLGVRFRSRALLFVAGLRKG